MRLFLFTLVALLTSCSSINNAPVNFYDVSRLEVPQPHEAHIYFMRPSAFFLALSSPHVLLNGKKVKPLHNS